MLEGWIKPSQTESESEKALRYAMTVSAQTWHWTVMVTRNQKVVPRGSKISLLSRIHLWLRGNLSSLY